jgi:hypothetical protein
MVLPEGLAMLREPTARMGRATRVPVADEFSDTAQSDPKIGGKRRALTLALPFGDVMMHVLWSSARISSV